MLRNDLIDLLSRWDYETVAVNVNNVLLDIETVVPDRDGLAIVLNSEDLLDTLRGVASGRAIVQNPEKPPRHS